MVGHLNILQGIFSAKYSIWYTFQVFRKHVILISSRSRIHRQLSTMPCFYILRNNHSIYLITFFNKLTSWLVSVLSALFSKYLSCLIMCGQLSLLSRLLRFPFLHPDFDVALKVSNKHDISLNLLALSVLFSCSFIMGFSPFQLFLLLKRFCIVA